MNQTALAQETRDIDKISVGIRHRRELGNIDGLAASIKTVGLLHPIVIRPDNTLIAGERRLAACRALGWCDVPVTVVDLDEIVRGEFAENSERKDFLPSEIEAIRRAMAPIEQAAAKKRQLDCHLIDFPALQKWFWNRFDLFETFGPLNTLNRSMGRKVPISEVRANIGTWQRLISPPVAGVAA